VPGAPSASVGATANRAVPQSVSSLPLTDQFDTSVDLNSWRGKTILLVPFLTLCADICPMTTGNLYQVEQALHADRVASNVEIVELSVDPGRDTPARLAAYAQLTGASWELVTESPAELTSIARFFGFAYQQVPEGNPPQIDWLTHQPLTYDVDHSDGFIVINPHGVERFVTDAAPDFHGHIDPTLEQFLSPLGRQHLAHAPKPDWTPADALAALGYSMQRSLPGAGS
jgi:cytochrome oxidase Cu insertion factor (SCO1/SenC/PrrC family)